MVSQILYTNDKEFDSDVLGAEQPVLVDFWAEWCAPCRAIAPVLDEIATDYSDRLTIAKVNVDESAGTPAKYRIRSIPTLMLFKGGEVMAQHSGALSKSQLAEFLEQHL
ncbi:MAG: thioredoxin TrxA [Gammaproteobacteria bacterium]|nr:thioredoxin TrxA [Gammaproteobacteria bacterium]